MELLKEFVITLVTTIIFITAIELIAPDNDMKKYIKFVLGLILVVVLLNPIVNFCVDGEGYLTKAVDTYTNQITSGINESTEERNKDNKKVQEDNFKENFNKNCESTLNNKFKDFVFESDVDCDVNFNDVSMDIKSLKIYAKVKGVRKVEKVDIGDHKDEEYDETRVQIRDFICNELKISKDKVQVNYK